MKTNKKFLTILTLCIALLLTSCGTTDAAGTDKTNESLTETGTVSTDSSNTALNDLYQQENQIFADHEAVWNKVFGMMSKSGVDPSANYADYLADTGTPLLHLRSASVAFPNPHRRCPRYHGFRTAAFNRNSAAMLL